MKTTVYLTLTLLALCLQKPLFAASTDLNGLLQKGLFEEEANQNLEAAIKNYQALIQGAEEQRKLVATAVFRLGECYRKQGRTNEAAAQYQRIVSGFTEQTTLVNLSRQNLVGLGVALRVEATEPAGNDQYRNLPSAQKQQLRVLIQQDLEFARKAFEQTARLVDTHVKPLEDLDRASKRVSELKRQLLAVDGLTTAEERQEYKNLVKNEIAIAEKTVDRKQKMVASGTGSADELAAAQREVLALKRELVLADSAPAQTSSSKPPAEPDADPEAKDIERLQAMLKDSPDLINAPGSGRLQQAVSQGKMKLAEFLLAHGADINVRGSSASTPLHVAVRNGNKDMVEFLLAHGADVNARYAQGQTPLHFAAELGYKAIAEILLANKADVNATAYPITQPQPMGGYGSGSAMEMSGATPLHIAVSKGHQAIVELLLKNEANVSIKDTSGRQPLHRAAQNGFLSIAQLLVSKKAEVNAVDNNGWTPLHCAVAMEELEIVEYFLKNGAKINALTSATPNESGRSPLHIAILGGNVRLLELLLKYKPDVNLRDSNGNSPVNYMFFCSGKIQSVRADMLALLVTHGADVNSKTRNGDTPLFLSIQGSETECVKILLAHKADLEMRNAAGVTPLLKAAELYVHKAIAEMLVQAGADVNAVCPPDSQTPLFYAIGCFQSVSATIPGDATSLIEMLVAHKANVNYMNSRGATPLTFAKNLETQNALGLNPGSYRPLPMPGLPGRSSLQEATGMTRAELSARIVEILKKAGANEAFERLNRIELTRGSETLNSAIFSRQGTNDWNRYSLLEVIARTYTMSDSPGVYGAQPSFVLPSPVPFPGGRLGPAGVNSSWPDFKNIRITRWDLKTGKPYEIPVDVEQILNSRDSSKDVWLEWGDAVEIPEADHNRNENWPGLSIEQSTALYKCLQRDVTIIVKGDANQRTLVPFSQSKFEPKPLSFSRRLQAIQTRAQEGSTSSPAAVEKPKEELPQTPHPAIASFQLKEVIELSKLLRTSSDTTRVKVKRQDPLTRNREFVLNLEKIDDPSKDLWLRNGDVIEIPEK